MARPGRPPKDPSKPVQPTPAERRHAEQTFAGMFRDGEETPESIIVKVMRGQDRIVVNGRRKRITKEMQRAAETLLPYRLPRLNSIDAQVKHVEMTHDEWIQMMEEEGRDDAGK